MAAVKLRRAMWKRAQKGVKKHAIEFVSFLLYIKIKH